MTISMEQTPALWASGISDWMELSGLGRRRRRRRRRERPDQRFSDRHCPTWQPPAGVSGLGFFGQGGADEIAEIQAQKAKVQAEIARLKGGGPPVQGGYQGYRAKRKAMPAAPPPPPPPMWPRVIGGLALIVGGAYVVNRVMKRKR